ncbi:SET domain-containing protein 5 [Colletotrichum tofieldiae]|nr:SET domain-containing protein 5 [Colletotrichum tofieldiae]GKT75044.1 SET domain-containing protein 5 [Colletotrichum tofieldiae]GKT92270.1 SET domain-containing protein 5 [Colletotrichum tofieldiae]
MSESPIFVTSFAQGSLYPKAGLLATRLPLMSTYPGSHDDLYIGTNEPLSKAKIKSMCLDAMLDVEPKTVNFMLDLADPLEQFKDGLREFGVFIDRKLPPIAIRDITWKTVYVAQDIVVGYEPDEFEVFDPDKDGEGDDYYTLMSPRMSPSNSYFTSDSSDAASLVGNDLGTIGDLDTFVTAELPLITTFKDTQGTKERLVIFANEFFEIRRSPTAGWSAFAVKTLYKGDQILAEKALYHAIHENVTSSVQALPEKERAIANDMFAYHSRDGETLEEAIWSTNSFVSRLPMKPDADGVYKSRLGSQDVAGLFPVAGRFNHSCFPKVNFQFRPEHMVLVFTVRDWIIEAGDELTISYGKDPSVLYYKYGFSCECGHCRGFDAMRSEWC